MTKPNDFVFNDQVCPVTGFPLGLRKREYFAAIILQGILSGNGSIFEDANADLAIKQADALIEALNKDQKHEDI